MKPFSIKEHLEHPDWKVVTREGRNARIVCTNFKTRHKSVLALVDYGEYECVISCSKEGKHYTGERESPNDLFFTTKKYMKWGLSLFGYSIVIPRLFNSKEEAQRFMEIYPGVYGSIVKVEWEE